MDYIVITTEMMKRLVKAVKNWSASGPDELHRFWLKHLTNLQKLDGTKLQNGNIIKSLSSDENYKYLGIQEADSTLHTKV